MFSLEKVREKYPSYAEVDDSTLADALAKKYPKSAYVYLPSIVRYGKEYGVDPAMLEKIAKQESGFRDDIVSGKTRSRAGATGLMQFMPETAKQYRVNPLDPHDSIRGAAEYLADLSKKYDAPEHVLAAYNWGPGNVDQWIALGADPTQMPDETRNYLEAVLGGTAPSAAPAQPELSPVQQRMRDNPAFAQLMQTHEGRLRMARQAMESAGMLDRPGLINAAGRAVSSGVSRGAETGMREAGEAFEGVTSGELGKTGLGVLQATGAPGAAVGDVAGETVRSFTAEYLPNDVAAALGTLANLPAQVATGAGGAKAVRKAVGMIDAAIGRGGLPGIAREVAKSAKVIRDPAEKLIEAEQGSRLQKLLSKMFGKDPKPLSVAGLKKLQDDPDFLAKYQEFKSGQLGQTTAGTFNTLTDDVRNSLTNAEKIAIFDNTISDLIQRSFGPSGKFSPDLFRRNSTSQMKSVLNSLVKDIDPHQRIMQRYLEIERALSNVRNVAELSKPGGLSLQDVLAIFTKGGIFGGAGYVLGGPIGALIGGVLPETFGLLRRTATGARLLRELEAAEPGSAKYNLLMQTINRLAESAKQVGVATTLAGAAGREPERPDPVRDIEY